MEKLSQENRIESFSNLLALHPWPNAPEIEGIQPTSWSLDGGGRHLMDSVISTRSNAVLLEVGSFMGGAAREWLFKYENLRCVCLDPWNSYLVSYVKGLIEADWALEAYGVDLLAQYASLLEDYGPLRVVQNNLCQYRYRCILVQAGAPEGYSYLKSKGLNPDVVFLDARKTFEEFDQAERFFPDAIICGDDWSWRDESGDCPIRGFAREVANRRSGVIFADRATFVVAEARHNLSLADCYKDIQ